ncbi:Uncharacterised protein [Mycobacterium tuberculosis]|nr:Uncharacterised protein [Mycobacterium tuberculosis]CPA80389.1 Uncharacterised protein [Mycobacterium tuberculosis]
MNVTSCALRSATTPFPVLLEVLPVPVRSATMPRSSSQAPSAEAGPT